MQLLKDIAIAISLANLCFFRVWAELLNSSNHYFIKAPPYINFTAIFLNVLLLATVFWVLVTLVRRLRHGINLAGWLFLLVLVFPLNSIRQQLPPLANVIALFGKSGFFILGLFLALLLVFVLVRWHRLVIHVAATVVLVLFPFALISFSQAAWFIVKRGVTFTDKPLITSVTAGKRSTTHVLWLLFDEMDHRITFLERPPTVKLPEIDRLKSQALYANNAYPPKGKTLFTMPSLITGRVISKAQPVGPNELMITIDRAKEAVGWSTQPSIFSKALEAGVNTAVVGWYHPYCRVLGGSLTACSWQQLFGGSAGSGKTDLFKVMVDQMYNLWPWRSRQYHIEAYLQTLKDGKKAVIDSNLGLVLVHFPVPHKPFIYERINSQFTLVNYSISGYLDNLVLADRALGELRQAMENAGTWENTIVLMTSDHGWRKSVMFDGKMDQRVPFVLKLAGQKESLTYNPAFNTVLTHDLILALLRGEVVGPESVMAWLDQHRSKVESSEYSNNL